MRAYLRASYIRSCLRLLLQSQPQRQKNEAWGGSAGSPDGQELRLAYGHFRDLDVWPGVIPGSRSALIRWL